MESAKHECNSCKKAFDRNERLQKHIIRGCSSRRECGICGRKFKIVKYLENHEKNAKPTACDICDKIFCHVSEMERHRRTSHIGMVSGGNIENDNLNQIIYPRTGFEEEEGYKEQVKTHWNKIRDSKEERTFYTEVNRTLTPDFTYNDLLDIIKDLCDEDVLKINLGFGFMLRNTVTGEYRYFYVSSNNLIFDRAYTISKMADVKELVEQIRHMDLPETFYLKRPSSGWILAGLPNIFIKAMYLKGVPLG